MLLVFKHYIFLFGKSQIQNGFEIEEEDGSIRYGKSKENRPNPIIGMGLFMDRDGIPLTYSLFSGNQNEQLRSLILFMTEPMSLRNPSRN